MQPLGGLKDEYLGEKEVAGAVFWAAPRTGFGCWSFRLQHVLDKAVEGHNAPACGAFGG